MAKAKGRKKAVPKAWRPESVEDLVKPVAELTNALNALVAVVAAEVEESRKLRAMLEPKVVGITGATYPQEEATHG